LKSNEEHFIEVLNDPDNEIYLQSGNKYDDLSKSSRARKLRAYLTQFVIRGKINTMMRCYLWKACSAANCYLIEEKNINYYLKLSSQYPLYPNPCFYQIEADLNRATISE
jgi:hypothetical protein